MVPATPITTPATTLPQLANLFLLVQTLLAAQEGTYAARQARRRGGDLYHAPPDAARDDRRGLVELARHAGHVADGPVELRELAVYVVEGDVRLPEKRDDLSRDVLDRLLGRREDAGQPQEHPRQNEESDGDPRE